MNGAVEEVGVEATAVVAAAARMTKTV